MNDWLQGFIDLVVQHPHWAGLLVFVTAMAESIVVVGMFVPGTAILIGIAAVAGLGELKLWPLLVWATLGAVAGDGVSYWIGHRYKEHIRAGWPLRERPELFEKGEAFFHRYGAMSVAIGRFVPGVRAIIPVVAGVVGMPPLRFYAVNILSAMVWAPAHILPGAGMGLALGVLGSIAGRLVAVLVGVLVFAGLAIWAIHLGVRWIAPGAARRYRRFVAGCKRRGSWVDRAIVYALDPDDPGTSTLIVMGVAVIALARIFVGLAEDVFMREQITRMDAAISTLVQGWRTPALDDVMIAITSLGDGVVVTAVVAAAVIWLFVHRERKLGVGLALTMVLAAVSVPALKSVLSIPRPIEIYSGADAFSFPSGHATSAAALYASLAWLATHNAALRWKIVGFALAGVMTAAIAASRVYLAAHWPSDVLAGLTLGLALAAIYALVFRRTDSRTMGPWRLVAVVLATLLVAGGARAYTNFPHALEAYRPRVVETTVTAESWLGGGWADLAAERLELDGSDGGALVLQADVSLAALRQGLIASGWQMAPAGDVVGIAGFLSPKAALDSLPPLPLTHAGRFAGLTMVRETGPASRLVLRFWPTPNLVLESGAPERIHLASMTVETVSRPLHLATMLHDREIAATEQQGLLAPLAGRPEWRAETRALGDRRVLLLTRPSPPAPPMPRGESSGDTAP
ncbi:bifunctional DedA family/phosphatase PAP2 family protein [Kaistia nematophila]|uniref:Bifunctional DedA family/phosphatase PAP2 family protein n=1 Tax=Kaistia nematophila TaxID=2994654 RepID=A0A9X3DX81_9HYPH|nr:bifunctional DedA family/phosphatase PAP2 family protein [Kaistia nematophila]MCX5567570.1 bifunctional DedA family/phosphatase PAP2 family protein [Kaistia nematophila]